MAVIWTILELIFLFFFFELPPVDDFVKSKYEEYLEHSQRVQNNSDNKQIEEDKKLNKVNQNVEQNSNCDSSMSASEQEKMALLPSDGSMKDTQALVASHGSIIPPPQNFLKRVYWFLIG